jgi:hypothetical protein
VVDRRTEAKRRRWADVVVIVAALYVFLAAIWSPPAIGPGEAAEQAYHGWWWWAHAMGGFLALLSVPLAMKQPLLAKGLAGLAGLIMLAGLFAFGGLTWLSVRALGIPGLAVLLAAPFIGPMPSPEEEGARRSNPLDPRRDEHAGDPRTDVRARDPMDR